VQQFLSAFIKLVLVVEYGALGQNSLGWFLNQGWLKVHQVVVLPDVVACVAQAAVV
jgi:hypothetical protein